MIHTYSFSITISNCFIRWSGFSCLNIVASSYFVCFSVLPLILFFYLFQSLSDNYWTIIISLNKLFFCWQNFLSKQNYSKNAIDAQYITLLPLLCVLITLHVSYFYLTMYVFRSVFWDTVVKQLNCCIHNWMNFCYEDLLIYTEYI